MSRFRVLPPKDITDSQADAKVGVEITDFNIEVGSPVIISHGGHMRILPGQILTLKCRAKGRPTPIVTWYKNDERINSKRGHIDITMESKGRYSKLKIFNARKMDSGNYSCHAESKNGFLKRRITVEVSREEEVRCSRNYCINGQCHVTTKRKRICECRFPFHGEYCERQFLTRPPPRITSTTSIPTTPRPNPVKILRHNFTTIRVPSTIRGCDMAVEKSLLHAGISIATTVFVMLIIVLCYLCRLQRSKSFVWKARDGRHSRKSQYCQTDMSFPNLLSCSSKKVLYLSTSGLYDNVEATPSTPSLPGCMCPVSDPVSMFCWPPPSNNPTTRTSVHTVKYRYSVPSDGISNTENMTTTPVDREPSQNSTLNRRNKLNIESHSQNSDISRIKRWYYEHDKADVSLCSPDNHVNSNEFPSLDTVGPTRCTCNVQIDASSDEQTPDTDFLINLHNTEKE